MTIKYLILASVLVASSSVFYAWWKAPISPAVLAKERDDREAQLCPNMWRLDVNATYAEVTRYSRIVFLDDPTTSEDEARVVVKRRGSVYDTQGRTTYTMHGNTITLIGNYTTQQVEHSVYANDPMTCSFRVRSSSLVGNETFIRHTNFTGYELLTPNEDIKEVNHCGLLKQGQQLIQELEPLRRCWISYMYWNGDRFVTVTRVTPPHVLPEVDYLGIITMHDLIAPITQ